ncbi:MAG: GNAT family N-acetyltransferase, partial [Myxococcota bacterium]
FDVAQAVSDFLQNASQSLHDQMNDDAHGNFYVLRNETGFVGCVALEVYGKAAILRSLSVKKSARGVGYGWLLADTAVQVARHRGVKRIYLITEHASDFFAVKLGFRVVDVSTVSHAVADSPTFRDQRDSGAIAMRLDL